ncbi:hypothetical protein N7528_002555 [Penicillium herquei]|nr:hypothetical protein N7528_002555 [Penicillium herquei]
MSAILRRESGEMHLDLSEIITVVRSKGLVMEHHKEEAIALLDTWRRSAEIDSKEIREILYFYKVLRFFIDDFQRNVPRPSWIRPQKWQDEIIPLNLSDIEKSRIFRALCRLQVLSNVFGTTEIKDDSANYRDNRWNSNGNIFEIDEEGYRLFYGAMPPWEYEEMGSVWGYLLSKYVPISEEVGESLRIFAKEHRPEGQDYTIFVFLSKDVALPLGRLGFEDEGDIDNFPSKLDSLVSIGPEFLYRVIHATPLERRNLVVRNATLGGHGFDDTWIGSTIESGHDDKLPWTEPADRHAIQDFEQFWSTLPSIERPNLAWRKSKIIRQGNGYNLTDAIDLDPSFDKWTMPGVEIMGDLEWQWCYAIWDDVRLVEWKAPLLEAPQHEQPGDSELPPRPASTAHNEADRTMILR